MTDRTNKNDLERQERVLLYRLDELAQDKSDFKELQENVEFTFWSVTSQLNQLDRLRLSDNDIEAIDSIVSEYNSAFQSLLIDLEGYQDSLIKQERNISKELEQISYARQINQYRTIEGRI